MTQPHTPQDLNVPEYWVK